MFPRKNRILRNVSYENSRILRNVFQENLVSMHYRSLIFLFWRYRATRCSTSLLYCWIVFHCFTLDTFHTSLFFTKHILNLPVLDLKTTSYVMLNSYILAWIHYVMLNIYYRVHCPRASTNRLCFFFQCSIWLLISIELPEAAGQEVAACLISLVRPGVGRGTQAYTYNTT